MEVSMVPVCGLPCHQTASDSCRALWPSGCERGKDEISPAHQPRPDTQARAVSSFWPWGHLPPASQRLRHLAPKPIRRLQKRIRQRRFLKAKTAVALGISVNADVMGHLYPIYFLDSHLAFSVTSIGDTFRLDEKCFIPLFRCRLVF